MDMNIVEFNKGVWMEYPEDFNGPVLINNNTRYISVAQYLISLGISVDDVIVQDNNLLIFVNETVSFNSISKLEDWDKINITPHNNSFIISIDIE